MVSTTGHKRFYNIYMLIILFIGISNSIGVLLFKDDLWNIFRRISPLSIVYSVDKDTFPKRSSMRIVLVTHHKERKFLLNRDFFQKLGGPHNYKISFWSKLTREPKLIDASINSFFQNFFCSRDFSFDEVEGEKIIAIKVISKENKEIRLWKCLP